MTENITKGQKFASKYYPEQKQATVRGLEVLDGETYVVYERNFKGSYNRTATIAVLDKATFLSEYRQVEDFFVEGGQYKYGSSTFYIKEVFTISNPINPKYRKQARAIIIQADGKRYMEMLDGYNFESVKRVR